MTWPRWHERIIKPEKIVTAARWQWRIRLFSRRLRKRRGNLKLTLRLFVQLTSNYESERSGRLRIICCRSCVSLCRYIHYTTWMNDNLSLVPRLQWVKKLARQVLAFKFSCIPKKFKWVLHFVTFESYWHEYRVLQFSVFLLCCRSGIFEMAHWNARFAEKECISICKSLWLEFNTDVVCLLVLMFFFEKLINAAFLRLQYCLCKRWVNYSVLVQNESKFSVT